MQIMQGHAERRVPQPKIVASWAGGTARAAQAARPLNRNAWE
jgi:hypothetical protein